MAEARSRKAVGCLRPASFIGWHLHRLEECIRTELRSGYRARSRCTTAGVDEEAFYCSQGGIGIQGRARYFIAWSTSASSGLSQLFIAFVVHLSGSVVVKLFCPPFGLTPSGRLIVLRGRQRSFRLASADEATQQGTSLRQCFLYVVVEIFRTAKIGLCIGVVRPVRISPVALVSIDNDIPQSQILPIFSTWISFVFVRFYGVLDCAYPLVEVYPTTLRRWSSLVIRYHCMR